MTRIPSVAAALLAAALAASALGQDAQAPEPPAAPEPLRFAWPLPAKAEVTENQVKRGIPAVTKYDVSLEKEESGDLRLRVSGFRFVEYRGKPADDPAVAPELQFAAPLATVIPDLLIGPDGRVKDVVGLDVAVRTMFEEFAKLPLDDRQKATVEAMRAQLATPEAMEAMKKECRRAWESWAEDWVGLAIPEVKGVEVAFAVRCPEGSHVKAPTLLRRLSGESEGKGLVKFTRESVLDGEDAQPVLDSWIRKMAAAARQPLPPAGLFTGMRVQDRGLLVCDAATLRPVRVLREVQSTWRMKSKSDRVETDRHEYVFAWK